MRAEMLRREVDDGELADAVGRALAEGYRLALVAAHEDDDRIRIVYLLLAGRPDRRLELTMTAPLDDPKVPSLEHLSFAAGRFEREMLDLYGITPVGHPQPRRLVRHAHWPQDWHPMRRDAGVPPEFAEAGGFPFLPSKGLGCTRFRSARSMPG